MKRVKFIVVCILVCSILVSCNKKKPEIVEPPHMVIFHTFEGIQQFVSSISSDITSYRYDDSRIDYNIHTHLTYNQANEIAQDIAGTMIPKIKDGVTYEGFSGDYYVGYDNPLHLLYKIGEIQYRFIYSYNVTETYENKDKVALRNVSIGSTSFELYAGEGRVYGTFMLGTTEIYVSVATDDPEAVNFECFEFVTITRNP